jgi:hypothetical protein
MEIETPILLTIHSVRPPKEYEACPYCFTKLKPEPQIEHEDVPETRVGPIEDIDSEAESSPSVNTVLEKVKDSGPQLLKKIKALIPHSAGSQNDDRKTINVPQTGSIAEREEIEEITEEPKKHNDKQDDQSKTEYFAKKDHDSSGCPESFGYLANRPSETPIPPQCLTCPKMVDCMLSPRERGTK